MLKRYFVFAYATLLLIFLLSGCSQEVKQVIVALPTPVIPTITFTATALPPTPPPTITPTATATPTATPTPLPVTLSVEVGPEAPSQGQTMIIGVQLDRAATVNGDFDGQQLTFIYNTPTDAWALVGVPVWSAIGERPLVLEAISPDGQHTYFSRGTFVQESAFIVQNINVPATQNLLLANGLRPAEDLYLAELLRHVSPEPLWEGPFTLPAQGRRTSPFGAHRIYQDGRAKGYHGGLDIAAPEGTAIFAPATGVVVMAESLFVRGNVIILDHGAGVYSLYFHLSQLNVALGQQVARGELIGLMGTTGLSTGSHLHWEVRIGDIFVDPDEWLMQDFRVKKTQQ